MAVIITATTTSNRRARDQLPEGVAGDGVGSGIKNQANRTRSRRSLRGGTTPGGAAGIIDDPSNSCLSSLCSRVAIRISELGGEVRRLAILGESLDVTFITAMTSHTAARPHQMRRQGRINSRQSFMPATARLK